LPADRVHLEERRLAAHHGIALVDPELIQIAVRAGAHVGEDLGLQGALYGKAALEWTGRDRLSSNGQSVGAVGFGIR